MVATPVVKVELDLTSDPVPTGEPHPQEAVSYESGSSRGHTPTDQEEAKAPTSVGGPVDSEQVSLQC